tara:strand:- start:671 stop:1279 length:609 start_codon:yes stop_codon:yes gene_type:complete
MKAKILTNEDNRARIALLDGEGNPAHELELVLCEGRGKDENGKPVKFLYWAFESGKESNLDLSDFQDWLGELAKADLLTVDVEQWIRDAIQYRLNNGKFKTLQRTSQDGKRLDNLTPQQKLEAIVKALGDGSAFKVRQSGDSKAKVEAKLVAEQDKGKRMAEIYKERRAIEDLEKAAKGDKKKPHQDALAALDLEFDKLATS